MLMALVLLFTSLALSPVPAEAEPSETFADDFQTGDFNGSTGSTAWVGPWIEVGESDGVGAGSIRVGAEPNCSAEPCLLLGRDPGPDASVEREADLSGFDSATLTFDYVTHPHNPGAGTASLEISDDGGGSWFPLDSWPLDSNANQVGSYDISDYLAPNTRIRFSVNGSSDDSHMNVDNLQVSATTEVCYLVGSNGGVHQMTTIDLADPDPLATEVTIGETGADITSIALDPVTGTLYAATADQLHTVDKATGVVSTIDPFGSSGPTVVNRIETLAFDPTTGTLYASHRRSGDTDLIVQVNPATGSIIPDAFGAGIDYVTFSSDRAVQQSLLGLAIDGTGQMWGMGWDDGSQEKLHTIDKTTGSANAVFNSRDISGLSFDDVGTLWALDPDGEVFEMELSSNSRAIDNLTIYAGLACPQAFNPPPPEPGVIVISEFDTRNDDFVELYNAGGSPVDISDFILEIDGEPDVALDQGGGPITLLPGAHYLLVESGTPLAASADQVFPFPGGLRSDLGLRIRDDAGTLLDTVGTQATTWFEGTALPSMPAGEVQSYERRGSGPLGNCFDTDNNVADFVHNWGFNDPQSMSDPTVTCGTASPASHVVISEFRPEGPNGEHDQFVELFNPTGGAVDISSWVFHITQPGLFRDFHVVPGGTVLDPGEHYLLSGSAGPTPADAQPFELATNYSAAWGDVVLKDEAGTIIDVLGYGDTGNGQLYEGTALPAYDGGTNDRSFARRNGGYTDTDNNVSDFVYAFAATPERGIPGPNRAPVFNQDLVDRSYSEGDLITISSPATDPDWGDTLTYSATGLPEGTSINAITGDIAGALGPNSSGTHAVTITVTDDGTPSLDATDMFTWTVAAGEVTYLVANSGGGNGGDDLLTAVDRTDANPVTNEANIGTGTGTWNIETAALQPGTNVLFAVENDQLGTINVTTGVFAPKPAIAGAGNGPVGLVAFDNIEGLTFNPFTGDLFGTHRRGTGQGDLLFRFDPATGAHIPGAFGGDDYVVIQVQFPYHHAADIAFDPTDGQLYVVHWDITLSWTIATLDPATGATTTRGPAPDDIVSLAFDETGRLYTSTETGGGAETLYELDKADGSVVGSIAIDNGSNYEAMAIAFPVDPNQAPVFNQDLLDRTDTEGSLISLSAAATDPDAGQDLAYTATGLPAGLAIDPGSGLITGTIGFAATGAYPVEILVTDDGIPNLGASDTFTWTVTEANQPPTFDQDLPDRIDAEGSAISLSAAATDPDGGDTLAYGATGLPSGLSIDTGSGLITGTIDYTAATGSPYAVTITVADNGSPSESATPDSFSWAVGNTNQPPTIVSPGAQTTPELAPFSITISASDPDGQIPSFSDGSTLPAWAVLTDNLDGTATIAGTPGAGDSGTTTVTITASDGGVPNLSDDAVFDITVTNTNLPPTITSPGNQLGAEAAPFSVLIAASDPDGTTVSFSDGSTLPAWATLIDNGDDTATITGTPGYTDAAVTTVTITVSDGSLTDDAIFDIVISNTNRLPTADPVADQTIAEGAPLTPLVVTASDPDGTIPSLSQAGLPSWASFVDNGDGTATITGTPGHTDAATSTVTITASDGSLTDDATFDITVTNTNRPPTANPVADQTIAEGTPLTPLVVTASDPDGTIPSLAATGLPGWASFVDNGDGTATLTGTPTYTDAATSTITVNVEDGGVPNLADLTTFDITVTNTNRVPAMANPGNQTVAENDPFSLVVTASDPDGTIPSLSQAGLPSWASLVDNGDGTATITGTPTYTDAATSTVTITASDGSLTDDAIFDITVTNTNRPPSIAAIADQTVVEGAALAPIVATAADPDGTIPSLAATGLPGWASFVDNGDGTATITGSPTYTDAATITVTITASDGLLTDDVVFDITVTDVNQAPVFDQDLLDRAHGEGAAISLAAVATDPDADTLTYDATGLPPGLSIKPTTGLISGTTSFTSTAGSPYAVTITVTDDGTPVLSATDTFVWTITNTNRQPIFDGNLDDRTDGEGIAISLAAAATDPDADTLTYDATGLPPGLSINPTTGLITGTTTYAAATGTPYSVTISITDDGTPVLSATDIFTWTITNTNRQPLLAPIGNQLGVEQTPITFAASATDPDSDEVVFTVAGAPTGATIDPSSGVFAWTPGEADGIGSYTVTVMVTDTGSPALSDSQVVNITVDEANLPPTIKPISDQLSGEGTAVEMAIVATDPDLPANNLTYSATGLPPGLRINSDTGLITGTVGIGSAGAHPVSVAVTDNATPPLLATATFNWTITPANRNPGLSPIGTQSGAEHTVITFGAAATDPDSNELVFALTGGPSGAAIDRASGVFTWTPSEIDGPGSFTAIVMVTDNGIPSLGDSQVVNINVTESNQAPTITPIADQTSEPGDEVGLLVVADDADLPANGITFTATGLPPGLTIYPNSGAIEGAIEPIAAEESQFVVVITATDDGAPQLSATTQFTWTVIGEEVAAVPNEPPVVTPVADQFTGAGGTAHLAVAASDADPISFGAVGLPPGLAIHPDTGVVSGSVAIDAVGSHHVTVTVTDSGDPGLQSTTTFTWTITDLPAAEKKENLVQALDDFEAPDTVDGTEVAAAAPIRRTLVVMGGAAAATTESLRWPFALLVALLVGLATVGRVGLYPLLWRGDRQQGTITLYDPDLSFGLIDPDGPGEAVHVHANAFPRRQRPKLTVGMRVRYRVLASDNRASAWGATTDE